MNQNKRPLQTEDQKRDEAIRWASLRMEEEGAPFLPLRKGKAPPQLPTLVLDDAAIARKVKEALLKARNLAIFGLGVRCNHGNVTIEGSVDSSNSFQRITTIGAKVRGVKSVILKLKMRKPKSEGWEKEHPL